MEHGLKEIEDGVCDSPEQLATKFPDFNGIVWITVVRRKDQTGDHGWRWQKWGKYVGVYSVDEMHNGEWVEYLSDCDGENGKQLIDEQYIFHVAKPDTNVLGLDPYRAYMLTNGKAVATHNYVHDSPFIAYLRTALK